MNFLARARAIQSSRRAIATTTQLALAAGVFLFAQAPLDTQLGQARSRAAISSDPGSKSAAREAKRAERAAAREAKKKDRASRSNHSDDGSLAKAKAGKKGSGSPVNLGDNDPLDGL